MNEGMNRVRDFFQRLGIKRVIQVDDYYASGVDRDRVVVEIRRRAKEGRLELLPGLESVNFRIPDDGWVESFDSSWDDLAEGQRQKIWSALVVDRNGADEDVRFAPTIKDLLGSQLDFRPMSLSNWRKEKEKLIRDIGAHETLFLFDVNYERENEPVAEGVRVASALVHEHPDALVGLLTHMETVVRQDANRIALLRKQSLNEPNPDELLKGFRSVALSRALEVVRLECQSAVTAAAAEATHELSTTSIDVVEQAIVRSSLREGAAEVDTALRILMGRVKTKARSTVAASKSVAASVAKLRRVVEFKGERSDAFPTDVRQLQRPELYEEAAFLNSMRASIDLGDIFEYKVSNPASTRFFILAAQSCDLAVRTTTGFRKLDSRSRADRLSPVGGFGVLLEIEREGVYFPGPDKDEVWAIQRLFVEGGETQSQDSKGSKASAKPVGRAPSKGEVERALGRIVRDRMHRGGDVREQLFELPMFDASDCSSRFVDLVAGHPIWLGLVDLCVLNDNGSAQLRIAESDDAQSDGRLLPAWQKRYPHLSKVWSSLLTQVHSLDDPAAREAQVRHILAALSPTLHLQLATPSRNEVSVVGLRRIGRLAQPRAGAMLARMARYASRYAFDHDYWPE